MDQGNDVGFGLHYLGVPLSLNTVPNLDSLENTTKHGGRLDVPTLRRASCAYALMAALPLTIDPDADMSASPGRTACSRTAAARVTSSRSWM